MTRSSTNFLTGQPLWLKVCFFGVALPAWLYIVVAQIEGNAKGVYAFIAFAIFALVAIAFIVANRHKQPDNLSEKGLDFCSSSVDSNDE